MEKLFCNVGNCPNPSRVSGMCPTHYEQVRQGRKARTIDLTPHPECAVSHCILEATSRKEGSLCQPHYQKKYRGKDPEQYVVPESYLPRTKRVCSEPECQKGVKSNGLCDYHRTRARLGKTVSKVEIKMTAPCKFESCEKLSSQGGWCQTHYEQLRLTGTVKEARIYGVYTRGELICQVPSCRRHQESREVCGRHLKLLTKYRVSTERLIEIWTDPVCSNPACDNTTRLHMDHDHSTGEFRALLCGGCNSALGMLKENPDRMTGLREYIERFS